MLYSRSGAPGYFRRLLSAHPGHAPGPEEQLVDDYVPSRGGLAPVADGFFYVGLKPDGEPRAIRFYDYALRQARDITPAPAQIEMRCSSAGSIEIILWVRQFYFWQFGHQQVVRPPIVAC